MLPPFISLYRAEPLPLSTEHIIDLLNRCSLTSTYFQHNGKHYKQLRGTAMVSSASVVVAEIVKRLSERQNQETHCKPKASEEQNQN